MVQGLNFIMVHIPDVGLVKDFYTEKLGLTIEDQQPGFIQFGQPGGKGATLAVGNQGAGEARDPIELWWYVDNAQRTHDKLVEQGVEVVVPLANMPFGRSFAVKDPAGQTIFLLEPGQPG